MRHALDGAIDDMLTRLATLDVATWPGCPRASLACVDA